MFILYKITIDSSGALGLYRVFQKELYNFESFTGIVYLDTLQEFLIPQLDEDDQEGRIHFQQDGAPPHYLGEVVKLFLKHPVY